MTSAKRQFRSICQYTAAVLAALYAVQLACGLVATNSAAAQDQPDVTKDRIHAAIGPEKSGKYEQRPNELQPYRVGVEVAFANDALLTAGFRIRFCEQLTDGIGRTFGQTWELAGDEKGDRVNESRELLPAGIIGLNRLSSEAMAGRPEVANLDKRYILAVERVGGGIRIAGREWDRLSEELGPVRQRTTYERRLVADDAVALLHDLFRLVVVVDEVQAESARLIVRAGELFPPDPDALLKPGTLLQPVVRYYDRDGKLQQIQRIPWTFLSVDNVDRGWATAVVKSGLRAPLGHARRRVEVSAIAVTPQADHTLLQLVAGSDQSRPPQAAGVTGWKPPVAANRRHRLLAGYDVTVSVDDAATGDVAKVAPVNDELRLFSDRLGLVTVPAQPGRLLVWLTVQSGGARLARVPLIPGLEPTATLSLPDDSLRLNVEGQLALLQAELVETVARRAVLMTQARQLARIQDWKGANEPLQQLAKLPDRKDYDAKLTTIRYPAIDAARLHRDRLAELRIQKLCNSTAELIGHYLDETKVDDLKHEIAELRDLDARSK